MRVEIGVPPAVGLSLALLAASSPAQQQDVSVEAPRAQQSLLLDAAQAGDAIVVVGERGHVLKSVDNGTSWRQIVVPTRATLTAVSFTDAGLGYIVGHDAVILRTRDGGDHWQRVHHAPEQERPLLDVYAVDPSKTVAVGAYGLYLESTDGGSVWREREFKAVDAAAAQPDDEQADVEDFHLNQIRPSASGRWYIAAEAGMAYRSDDEGAHWLRLDTPYEGSYFGVLPLAGDRVWLYGLQGTLLESGDAGRSWRRIDTGTRATLADALTLGGDRVVIGGYAGVLLIAGAERTGVGLTQLDRRMSISSVLALADGDLLLVGTRGMMRVPSRRLEHVR